MCDMDWPKDVKKINHLSMAFTLLFVKYNCDVILVQNLSKKRKEDIKNADYDSDGCIDEESEQIFKGS